MAFDLDPSYKQVPERIADLKAKHPDATFQPADLAVPFQIVTVGDRVFVAVVAACYRSPDDQRPGIGMAWEPFPGKTPYTRDSELQNAETSAWGRAAVAALASESKSIASAEEVRNRRADHEAPAPRRRQAPKPPAAPSTGPGASPPSLPGPVADILEPLNGIGDAELRAKVKKEWVEEFGQPAGLDTSRYMEATQWVDAKMSELESA